MCSSDLIDPGMGQIFETPGKQPFSFDPQHDPPNWLRLHLSNDRAAVEIECDPQSWAKGYLIQLWSDQAEFSTALELPIRKITVPFKEFGLRTKIRATVLNFTSDMLVRSDALGTPHVIRARELAASALETKSVTRDQLIALKPGETLEFGPNLRWVKK